MPNPSCPLDAALCVLPRPAQLRVLPGHFTLSSQTLIFAADERARPMALQLQALIRCQLAVQA